MAHHRVTLEEVEEGFKERVVIPICSSHGRGENKTLEAHVFILDNPASPQYVVTDHLTEVLRTQDLGAAVEKYNSL